MRRRKGDALVWKCARAFLLLDADYVVKTVCEVLDIGPTVLTKWKFAIAGMGLPFFGLKDCSQCQCQCQCHLSAEQEKSLETHFTNNHARNADEICAYILAEYGQSYCPSGAVELMQRLGFTYKKPQSMPAQADEAKQEAFTADYEALMPQH